MTIKKTLETAVIDGILHLSQEKFYWKTTGKIDLIEDLFDGELVFIHITGHITTKSEWDQASEIPAIC